MNNPIIFNDSAANSPVSSTYQIKWVPRSGYMSIEKVNIYNLKRKSRIATKIYGKLKNLLHATNALS